jgi:hypothetical protein
MNTVKSGETPARIKTVGDYTYLCFPDYGINDLDAAGWAIKRIDSTDSDDVIITWANGSLDKVLNAADVIAGTEVVTWKNIV